MRRPTVIQHTSADYLGLIEDHLEGRRIGFSYVRPFTEGVSVPRFNEVEDGLILLGGGPWGAAGVRDVPTVVEEVELTRACLMHELPVLGIGLGAQILALAADGSVEPSGIEFRIATGTRTDEAALNGFLPETFPLPVYMRDRPVPPSYAQVLAHDEDGRSTVFQIGENALGFAGHPGFKLAMAEDLIMEFKESPTDPASSLAALRDAKTDIEDALVPIMTGIVQLMGWMRPKNS